MHVCMFITIHMFAGRKFRILAQIQLRMKVIFMSLLCSQSLASENIWSVGQGFLFLTVVFCFILFVYLCTYLQCWELSPGPCEFYSNSNNFAVPAVYPTHPWHRVSTSSMDSTLLTGSCWDGQGRRDPTPSPTCLCFWWFLQGMKAGET